MYLPGGSLGFPVGVLCGVVCESHWWSVWWAAGLVGSLVGACGCWPCVVIFLLGAGIYGGLWHWVSEASLGLQPLDSPLKFGAGFPRVEALGGFGPLFVVCPCDAGFLVGGLAWG